MLISTHKLWPVTVTRKVPFGRYKTTPHLILTFATPGINLNLICHGDGTTSPCQQVRPSFTPPPAKPFKSPSSAVVKFEKKNHHTFFTDATQRIDRFLVKNETKEK